MHRSTLVNRYKARRSSASTSRTASTRRPSAGTADLRALGDGDINFAPIFAAAKNSVHYYLYEYDPVTPGNNGGFNPFTTPTRASPPSRATRPRSPFGPHAEFTVRRRPARAAANNAAADHVTNTGDAPLIYHQRRAGARRRRRRRRQHDARRLLDRQPGLLGARRSRRGARPPWPTTRPRPRNEAAPAVPAGTCTVNVGFKPTRTNYTSVARLQFTSNADDATERVLLAGKSTGDAHRRPSAATSRACSR